MPWYSVFSFLFFCLEVTVKRALGWERFLSLLWQLFWKCHSESYLISAVFKALNNCEAHWQRRLKDLLQLKILRAWNTMHINSFLEKYDETKMGEGALKIISCTKIRSCYLKNIAPRYFTYYCVLIFLINKPYFQIQPSVDQIIFSKIPLPVCLLILCSF